MDPHPPCSRFRLSAYRILLLALGALAGAPPQLGAIEDDFSQPSPPPVLIYEANAHAHRAEREQGALRMQIRKRGWDGWMIRFASPIDLSAAPRASLRLRTPHRDVRLRIFAVEDLAAGKYGSTPNSEIEAIRSQEFNDYSFDFGGAEKVDLKKVTGLLFNFNPGTDFEGELFLDDLRIGEAAIRMPSITLPEELVLPLGSAPVRVRAHDVRAQGTDGAVTLTVTSSDPAVVPPPSLTRQEDLGIADLEIRPLALGEAEIAVTANPVRGDPKRVRMRVRVTPNQSPTCDPIAPVELAAGIPRTLRITGITDGDPDVRQKIRVTAVSSNPALAAVTARYRSDGGAGAGEFRVAELDLAPAAGGNGEAEIAVSIADDGGTTSGGRSSIARKFAVRIHPTLNAPPKLEALMDQTLDATDDRSRRVYVGGLDNGSGSATGLTVRASSSNPELVPHPGVEFRKGDSHAFVIVSAPGTETGDANVTVTVTDSDGAPGNNGPQSAVGSFTVRVRPDPVVDFVEDYNTPDDADALSRFPETEQAHELSLPASEPGSLRVEVRKEFVWAGLWYQLPREIDLTGSLRISARLRASQRMKCRLYLMDREKNYTSAAPGPEVAIEPGEFRDYVFDFRGNLAGAMGKPVDASKVHRILFNFDPGQELHGTVEFDDLRIGRSARLPIQRPAVTLDPLPDLYLLPGAGAHEVTLTGLSDGFDGSTAPAVSAVASDPSVVRDLRVGPVEHGSARIRFMLAGTGESAVTLTASAAGSDTATRSFQVKVGPATDPATITIDPATRHQTIDGLGAYIASPGTSAISLTDPVRGAQLARDIGMSLARLGIIEADWEEANDNANPDAAAFRMATDPAWEESARRLAIFRERSGVERYLLSVWAPGAFSMRLKGRSCFGALSIPGSTKDHPFGLSPAYLDEFTEHIAAWHHWLLERTGIAIEATSLGNEVQFTQPYPSAVYGIDYYHRVWNTLGARLEREGLPAAQFGAEILPAQNEVLAYFRPLAADPVARKYLRALAYHGYVGLGVNPGTAEAKTLASYAAEAAKAGARVWMTETSGNTDDWSGAYELGESMFAALTTGSNSAWVFWTFANNTDEGGYLLANRWTPGGRFYAVKQMMKHIRPGDIRIGAASSDPTVEPGAFRSAKGDRAVLVLKNGAAAMRAVRVPSLGASAAVYQSSEFRHHQALGSVRSGDTLLLPPKSFTTLVTAPPPGGMAEAPAIHPRHATHNAPLRVQITTPTDGAVIRFTTDGSDPTERSPVNADPMMLTADTLLKVRAFRDGMRPSPVSGAHYQFTGETR